MWLEVKTILNCKGNWFASNLEVCFQRWMRDPIAKAFKILPCFIIWEIWLHWNVVLFENEKLSTNLVVQKGLCLFYDFTRKKLLK